jgi:NhaP-type Na+/H+ or K+/H+ antiporter
VVPRLLELREQGYGVDKGISTFIICSACLDNVLAISLFGVTLNFVFPNGSLPYTILQGPLQVVIGLAFGFVWGGSLGLLFSENQSVSVL